MGGQQNPLLAVRVPLDDQIRHRHRRPVEGAAGPKLLITNVASQLAKVFDQQLLLGLHAGRAADARPNGANLLQILVSFGSVEGDVGQRQLRAVGRPQRQPVCGQQEQIAERGQAHAHDRGDARPQESFLGHASHAKGETSGKNRVCPGAILPRRPGQTMATSCYPKTDSEKGAGFWPSPTRPERAAARAARGLARHPLRVAGSTRGANCFRIRPLPVASRPVQKPAHRFTVFL